MDNRFIVISILIILAMSVAYTQGLFTVPVETKPLLGCWYSVFWHEEGTLGYRHGISYEHWQDWVRLHPTLGHYSSGDPKIINTYFDQMREIGVDFIILDDTNGIWIDELNRTGDRPEIDLNVRAIFEVADKRGDIKVAMAIGGALWMRQDLELHKKEVEYVWMNFANRPSYFKFHDKPLLVVYAEKKYSWSDDRFTVRWATGVATEEMNWGWRFQYPQPVTKEVVGATPGWDTAHLGAPTTPVDRENGELFRRMLKRAIDAKPEVILVTSWDDWAEETAIADTEEWGSLYRSILKESLLQVLSVEAYLIGDKSNGAIFLVHGNMLHWISSMLIFNRIGFSIKHVKWHPKVSGYDRGYDLNSLPYPLLMYDVQNGAIYYFWNGQRYWIHSMQEFFSRGFKTEWLVSFTHAGCEQYPKVTT